MRAHRRCAVLLLCVVLPLGAQQLPPELAPAPETAEVPPAQTIAAETTPLQDRAIEQRLREIFAELEGAEGIRVEVRSGVVALSGEVLSPTVREQAVRLARQVQGVVEVRDETTLVRGLARRLAPVAEQLGALGSDIVGFLPVAAVALLVFAAFWLLAVLVARWEGLFRRFTANEFLADFLRAGVKLVIVLVGLLVALEVLDATAFIGTALGAAGLVGLVLGFALRDTVENYIAGILLSLKQPFVPHDRVLIAGHEGDVLRLTPRATLLMTLDGNHVRIPNATVFNGIVVNFTRNPRRRFEFDVGVGTEESLVAAQQLAAETLVQMEGVLADPPPRVDVHALGEFNVVLRVYGWVDQRAYEFLKVRSEAIRLVKEAFDAAGIAMPEPVRNVRLERRRAEAAPRGVGPRQAIDVRRRTEITEQIAEERRRSDEPDLLRPDAPCE